MNAKKLQQLEFYTARGLPIFPLHWLNGDRCVCGDVNCTSPGKHPLVKGGFLASTADAEQVKAWHERWPDANWGMRTGSKDSGGAGVLVVDIDQKHGGYVTWALLEQENPGTRIETVTVRTGGGGEHLWFTYPHGVDIRSGANVLGLGVDIRANGGYVLVPPSRTNKPYTYKISPSDVALGEVPPWMMPLLNGKAGEQQPVALRNGDFIPEGQRHDALVLFAGSMRRVGMKGEEIEAALSKLRDIRFSDGEHPVTDEEIRQVVQWICTKPRDFMHTDLGNAERFIDQHSQDVRYCEAWNKWLVWDGKRWSVDDSAELKRKAYTTVRGIYAEAAAATDEKKRKEVVKHAVRSEARSKVDNMLDMAKAFVPIKPDHLDRQPMLLNVNNGLVNLVNGDLLPHSREFFITKLINYDFDPGAQCPEWEKFIDLITGNDKELALFLQLAVGYTLTGRTDEHCLFFLYGTGQNGKTTFTETIRRMMGDYAQRTDIEALMAKWNTGQANPYVADMAGARFVLASEIPENRKVNEALIKDLTGGDSMTARHLFSNPFTFRPTHKLWLFGNHKPKVTGTDWGFWRRMRVIPFNVTIPEDIRKPFSEVMKTFEAEMPGILSWAVLGSVLWQTEGLDTASAVQEATKEYRTEQDVVQQFLDERCEAHPDHTVTKDALYSAWRKWCEDSGEVQASRRSKTWFTRQMTKRGYESGGAGGHSLNGLQLK